jgi:hypothetical protein
VRASGRSLQEVLRDEAGIPAEARAVLDGAFDLGPATGAAAAWTERARVDIERVRAELKAQPEP